MQRKPVLYIYIYIYPPSKLLCNMRVDTHLAACDVYENCIPMGVCNDISCYRCLGHLEASAHTIARGRRGQKRPAPDTDRDDDKGLGEDLQQPVPPPAPSQARASSGSARTDSRVGHADVEAQAVEFAGFTYKDVTITEEAHVLERAFALIKDDLRKGLAEVKEEPNEEAQPAAQHAAQPALAALVGLQAACSALLELVCDALLCDGGGAPGPMGAAAAALRLLTALLDAGALPGPRKPGGP